MKNYLKIIMPQKMLIFNNSVLKLVAWNKSSLPNHMLLNLIIIST